MSLRNTILAAEDLETEELEVPQWGVTIQVRSMDGRTRARLIQEFSDEAGRVSFEKLYPDLVILGVYDPDTGEQVFTEDDRDLILSKSGVALEAVATAVMRVSGLTPKAVDEAGKSSSSDTPNGASTSS